MVVVLDPDESKVRIIRHAATTLSLSLLNPIHSLKDYLDQVAGRTKEKRYTFDIAFEPSATNEDVYNGTVKE